MFVYFGTTLTARSKKAVAGKYILKVSYLLTQIQ